MASLLESITQIIKVTIDDVDGEDNVTELNFSEKGLNIGQITPEVKAAIELYGNVDFLGLSECKLTSLQNFPNLPKLATVDLKTNQYLRRHSESVTKS